MCARKRTDEKIKKILSVCVCVFIFDKFHYFLIILRVYTSLLISNSTSLTSCLLALSLSLPLCGWPAPTPRNFRCRDDNASSECIRFQQNPNHPLPSLSSALLFIPRFSGYDFIFVRSFSVLYQICTLVQT